MTTTYCNRKNIVSIIGEASLITAIDDSEGGDQSAVDESRVTDAINRGAVEMNESLGQQYSPLSALQGNDWCKWANAYLAAFFLQSRRGNTPVQSVIDNVQTYRDKLAEIRFGRFRVPEQAPSFDHLPSVSNFSVELGNTRSPVAVNADQSTTTAPVGKRKRNRGGYPFLWW